jgi:hypothetical protein
MKKFEEHFLQKYPNYAFTDIDDRIIKKHIPTMKELIKIDSVKKAYHNDKLDFMTEAALLIEDDEITMTMAAEMEPYQLAILRLNPHIDNQTRLFAELNWE